MGQCLHVDASRAQELGIAHDEGEHSAVGGERGRRGGLAEIGQRFVLRGTRDRSGLDEQGRYRGQDGEREDGRSEH
jgi:hypothetical protein